MAIKEFKGDYDWLSNFHMAEVEFEGKKYPSTEHAYQAAKTLDPDGREIIAILATAKEAKKWGKKLKIRKDWDNVKLAVMETVLREKFTKHQDLKEKLLATKNEQLSEGNWWGDEFWGVDNKTGAGKNHLGKLLMKIRAELAK